MIIIEQRYILELQYLLGYWDTSQQVCVRDKTTLRGHTKKEEIRLEIVSFNHKPDSTFKYESEAHIYHSLFQVPPEFLYGLVSSWHGRGLEPSPCNTKSRYITWIICILIFPS